MFASTIISVIILELLYACIQVLPNKHTWAHTILENSMQGIKSDRFFYKLSYFSALNFLYYKLATLVGLLNSVFNHFYAYQDFLLKKVNQKGLLITWKLKTKTLNLRSMTMMWVINDMLLLSFSCIFFFI